jgi:hypothetical protein
MIKTDGPDSISLRLRQLLGAAELYSKEDLRTRIVAEIDRIIDVLSNMRKGLADDSVRAKSVDVIESISNVLEFLEQSKSDQTLQVVLSGFLSPHTHAKPELRHKREAVVIIPDLSNGQIRELLKKDLSKAELKQIAVQRSISVGKRSAQELRAAILSFIDKQESYDLLRR